MFRFLFPLVLVAVVTGAAVHVVPRTTHSQQPATVDLDWDVAPVGLLADQRLRDGIDQLVDSSSVLSSVSFSGSLRYAGALGATQGRRDQVRLLFAAAGFDQPGTQLAQQRQCRLWIEAPALDAKQRDDIAASLTRAVVNGLSTLGIRIDPCTIVSSPIEADLLIWSTEQPSPLPQHDSRPQGQSFLVALPRPGEPVNIPDHVAPPVTGDGGLAGR